LVIPWTTNDESKEKKYRKIIEEYFKDVGFEEVIFLGKDDNSLKINEKFEKVDVIYLPGGDPQILFEEMKKRNLDQKIKDFEGIIIGNSAGAIVLSKGKIEGNKIYHGFGIVDFYVKVHFSLNSIHELSKDFENVVGIPERGWICVLKL